MNPGGALVSSRIFLSWEFSLKRWSVAGKDQIFQPSCSEADGHWSAPFGSAPFGAACLGVPQRAHLSRPVMLQPAQGDEDLLGFEELGVLAGVGGGEGGEGRSWDSPSATVS
jgi:hypothetical protein